MAFTPIEEMRIYGRAEWVGDTVWDLAATWPDFARRSVGLQLVRSADSIGANIAEGHGRFHTPDICKFLYYARGSLRETVFWIRRAHKRGLLDDQTFDQLSTELDMLGRELNQLLKPYKTPNPKS